MEAARKDREAYERLSVPKTLVVRFGSMRLVGEYPYNGDAKPGCGSKIVVRTHRGTEMGEMLTSTCPNAGCSKSVSRQEMLQYIENSGGKDFPFFTEGRALRVATAQDMGEQSRIDGLAPAMLRFARERAAALGLAMKIVEAEPILGGERLTFYFTSEERLDFRELAGQLSHEFNTRIDLRQVGARDEARLIADYERCGQHCCCKQFLKVLKPISIKAAKTQKATLDPLKISGRCGRLMCCLRYEDETYTDLVKRLPKMKKIVGTPHGVGMVVDRQILTQLVLVRLEHDGTQVAVPVEELCAPEEAPAPGAKSAALPDPMRGAPEGKVGERRERRLEPGQQRLALERLVRPAMRVDRGLDGIGVSLAGRIARPDRDHGTAHARAALNIGDAVSEDAVEERPPFLLGPSGVVPHQPHHRVLHGVLRFRAVAQRERRNAKRPAFDAGQESVECALPVQLDVPRGAGSPDQDVRIERSRALHRLILHGHPTPCPATVYNGPLRLRLTLRADFSSV